MDWGGGVASGGRGRAMRGQVPRGRRARGREDWRDSAESIVNRRWTPIRKTKNHDGVRSGGERIEGKMKPPMNGDAEEM
jgi:hypothetical protein